MKKYLRKYIQKKDMPYIASVLILGSLNHFLYEWLGCPAFIALFCPVNESVWEHLKLLFFPALFMSVWMYLKSGSQILRFFYCHYLGVFGAMSFTLVLFYTYTGVIGRHFLIIDLLIFFLAVLLSFYLAEHFSEMRLKIPAQNLVFSLWIITALCFFVFTCYPPNLPLFFPAS